jgi:hypothetical protein
MRHLIAIQIDEDTPDMPRWCSTGSGGIGTVAEFILGSRGYCHSRGASEPSLAPRTTRDQANWHFSFSRRASVPLLLSYFYLFHGPTLGAPGTAGEVRYLWGHPSGYRDFEDAKPEYSGDRNIYQAGKPRRRSGTLQGVTEREHLFDSSQGNICDASWNLPLVSQRAWMFLGACQRRSEQSWHDAPQNR